MGETAPKPPGANLVSVRVLVIEDDREMAEAVAFGLRQTGMAVDVALDGPAGLTTARVNDYDVIVLDRDLPGMHGDELCAKLVRDECRSRVLMLTAAGMVDDLVDGLALGADDYLTKPFDFPVLVARIGALARRAQPAIPPLLRREDLVLNSAQHRVSRAGREIELAPKEFGVLELLLASQGRCVSAEDSWHGYGTRLPTRSQTPSRSPSAACAQSSGSRR